MPFSKYFINSKLKGDTMKAIVTRQNADGTYDSVGMNNAYLTSQYRTIKGLLRYGIAKHFKGLIRIELYFGNLYQEKPDKTIFVTRCQYADY
jgi:hypothetical protein